MDVAAVRAFLRPFEDPAARTLRLPATSLTDPQWAAVRTLLDATLAGRTLTLAGITSFPPAAPTDQVVYAGGSGVLLATADATNPKATLTGITATFTVDAGGNAQLRLDAAAPGGWTLAVSLTGLAGTTPGDAVTWEDAALLLTSAPVSDARFAGPVQPFVNVAGTVATAGAFARAGVLLPTGGARTVAGHVDLAQGAMPVLRLAPAVVPPTSLDRGFGLSAGAELRTMYKHFEAAPQDPPYPIDQTSIAAHVTLGGQPATFRAVLLPDGDALPFTLDAPVPLSGLSDLSALVEGADVAGAIPAAVPAATGWRLEGASLAVDLDRAVRASVSVDVSLTTGGWPILPGGLLTVDQLGVRALVSFDLGDGLTPAASLYGRIVLAKVPLDVTVAVPMLIVTAELPAGLTVSVGDVLEQLLNALTGIDYRPPTGGMTIVELAIGVDARNGTFMLQAAIATDWRIVLGDGLLTLGLDDVGLLLEHDGEDLGAMFEAGFSINTARLWAAVATSTGTGAGWHLSGGLRRGDEIDVLALFTSFINPSPPSPPGERYGIPELKVTLLDLALSLDDDGEPTRYRIAGAMEATWEFAVFPGDHRLGLRAAIDLAGERGAAPLALGPGVALLAPAEDSEWVVGGTVSGELWLFGLRVTAAYTFATNNDALTFGVWWGTRGLEATLTRETTTRDGRPVTRTILRIRFGDLSLGEILEFLIGLAVPGETRRLPAPWDVLYQLDFKNLNLTVDMDTYDVTVTYDINLHLGFASLERIGLTYTTAGGEGQVLLQLTGDFLGQPYGIKDSRGQATEPLTWDVVNEPAPSVPGKGGRLVDIRYVALGQRVALPVPDDQLRTVEQTLTAMRDAMRPVPSGAAPLAGAQGLRYDAGTGWLFGVDATILDTLTLSLVFYDPRLYGALIELKGERAGSLAGLRVELVYRRVTDAIGELSVDLQVPEAFRNFEFGEVSITLGLIHVDIFTNGNFRVDIGFPAAGDFSRAFCVQVFPFIGRGGFYLAVLTGATSDRVPRIGNGTFDPVIEAGVGLSVGVGKEFRKGPLSAGLALEVFAILEGVYAPFHPYDATVPKDTYYWFQGTAGIVGKLYGSVDFVVIKAEVSLVARAQAVLTIQAHEETHVALTLQVTARASVTVLFITVHFSFDLELDASFSMGARTPAPWLPETRPPPPAHRLRQQRPQVRLDAPHARARALLRAVREPDALLGTPAPWTPVRLYDNPKMATLQFLPALTVAAPSPGAANAVQVVLLLAAENKVRPAARTAVQVAQVATAHLHATSDDGDAPFDPVLETFLRWALKEGGGAERRQRILRSKLVTIVETLHDPAFVAATFAWSNLMGLFEDSLHVTVVGCPADPTPPDPTSATFLGMLPALSATVGSTSIDYATGKPVSQRYRDNLAAYVEQLATNVLADAAPDPLAVAPPPPPLAGPAPGDGDPSLASVVFGDGLALLTRVAVQAAVDLLDAFPVPIGAQDRPSLLSLAERFDPVTTFDVDGAEVEVGVTPLSIAEDNQGAALAAVSFDVKDMHYQVRAGQTLNAVAAAPPQQAATGVGAGPLSGASVGAANADAEGFLRAGALLTIPAFTYTPVAGDTTTLVTALLNVRNAGTAGIADLDWWRQAIATLNENGIDWTRTGTTIDVPTALHDSTTRSYTIHQDDNLDRVAATLATWTTPGNPVTAPYSVGPFTHVVTPTDRFTTLTAAFPGLAQTALIAANTGADVLAPLAVAALPPFGVTTLAGQTLAGLAAALDLTLAGLVRLVEGTAGLFARTDDGRPLRIHHVPAMAVDDLVAAIVGQEPGNRAAAQVSRFLLHGLRVPSPQDRTFTDLTPAQVLAGAWTGTLLGVYAAAGLQFGWDLTALTITLRTSADWVTLQQPTVVGGRVTGGAVATDQSIAVTLTDAPPFSTYLPSTTLTLATTAAAMPLAETRPQRNDLPQTIHWQAAARPVVGAAADPSAPGEPSLWPFTTTLAGAARAGRPAPTPAFALRAVPLDAPAGTRGADLTRWAWATHVEIAVRRVPAPGADGGWLDGTYVIDGADPAGQDMLYDLWQHLPSETGAQMFLLHAPNAAGPAPGGLVSDALAAGDAYILKTNLSTQTRPPGTAARAQAEVRFGTPPSYTAALTSPAAFAAYLWEASTVQAGGFFLHYSSGGAGLPDALFDGADRATLTLVCLLASQTGRTPGRGLLSCNTCAVVLDNVDAATSQVYAEQTGGSPPVTRAATVPPGTVGFTLSRTDPYTPPARDPPPPTPAQLTQLLYNLFGFATTTGGGFRASNAGLPAGPTGGGRTTWTYQRVLDAATLALPAGRVAQHCTALPDPATDPYAGVSATAEVTVALGAQDAFGNTATAADPPTVPPLPVRYTDPIVGLAEWPGAAASYAITTAGGVPQLKLTLALQTATLLPGPGADTAVALRAASAFALRYERVFRQLSRPGVTVSAVTSLAPASATTPLPLSAARFTGFAAGAYAFASQLTGLRPLRYTTPDATATLAAVATAWSVTPADLLDANADHDARTLWAGPVVVPTYVAVKQRETLTALAARTGVDAATLLRSYDNASTTIPAGTSLVIAARTLAADPALTLAQTAAAAGCTVADLATDNAATTALLVPGIFWSVRGTDVVSSGATFTTLVADFAAAGIRTTPAEIAAANADRPNVLATGTPGTLTIEHLLLTAPATVAATVAAHYADVSDFATRNAAVPGVLDQGAMLQTGLTTATPPAATSVRAWAERALGITVARLAQANSVAVTGGPALPPLAADVDLLLPALLDPAALTAVPLAVGAGQSLDDLATLLGTASATLGVTIQDQPGLFNPGQPVRVGTSGPVDTTAEDSIATLLARFPAPAPTLAALIAQIAPSRTLLRAGAALVAGPAPAVPAAVTTLTGLAAVVLPGGDVVALARVNAALDGFLDPSKSLTYNSVTTRVGAHGTLTSLYRRAVPSGVPGFDAFLKDIAGADLLRVGARVLLPPPPATAVTALPAGPAVTATITALHAAVTITRPAAEVATEFGATSPVGTVTTPVGTVTTPVGAATSGEPAGYDAFAAGLQSAYAGALRVAAGQADAGVAPGRSQLYVVRFARPATTGVNAIEEVSVNPASPSFFALAPLCRELVSRSADVRTYVSGADVPLPAPAVATAFRAIDVQSWAADALAAIDLVLSAPYAAAAYRATADVAARPFDQVVEAKRVLAGKVAAGATAILEDSGGSAADAARTLEQVLAVSLTQGWDVAAVAQVPTTIDAAWAASGLDAGGHRLAVKATLPQTTLDHTTTLSALALDASVGVTTVADVLGATPNLLREGVPLRNGDRTWRIGAHDTLAFGATTLGLDLAAFAVRYATTAPLFRDGASATLTATSTTVVADDTLSAVADRLAAGVAAVAIANQDLAGLLTGTAWIDGARVTIGPGTDTLRTLAAGVQLSVRALAEQLADQPVLVATKIMHMLALPPEAAFAPGKIGLDASGNTSVVLSVADPAQWRRLLIDVDLEPIGLEYLIRPAAGVTGYERSDWLTFVSALSGPGVVQPATIATSLGQLDVPVPLRAYPVPPRLVAQAATPGYRVSRSITEAKAWDYTATFEADVAAQDTLRLQPQFAFRPAAPLGARSAGTDPFAALAELAYNLDPLRRDLAGLLAAEPDAVTARAARSAVVALGELAERIAATWGPVIPDPPVTAAGGAGDGLEPDLTCTFALRRRLRREAGGTVVIDRFILTREAGRPWGPDGLQPLVGYVDDAGALQLLRPQVGGGDELVYIIPSGAGVPGVTAFRRRVYALRYERLDAVRWQNARSSLWIERNDLLVPGRTTTQAFRYRTPENHYPDLCAPALVHDEPIVFGTGPASGLPAALRTLFTDLLGTRPADAAVRLKLTIRQGYHVQPPSGDDPGLPMLTPVAFRPLFAYTDRVPADVGKALAAVPPLAPGVAGFVTIDIMMFSAALPGSRQPLLQLPNLTYTLTPA